MPLRLIIFLVVFLAIIFQVSVVPNFFYSGAAPDLIIVFLVFFASEVGFSRAWKWAIFLGFVSDLIFFSLPGTSALSFLVIAYLSDIVSRRFLSGQKIWKAFILGMLAAICSAFDCVLTLFLAKIINYFYETQYSRHLLWMILLKSALYNFVAAFIIFWPFKKIKKLVVSRREIEV